MEETLPMFKTFSTQHWVPIVLVGLFMTIITWYAKNHLQRPARVKLGFWISLIPAGCVLLRNVLLIIDNAWNAQEELPLHLCRLLALLMPWIIYTQNRKWFGVAYFLVIVGTLQAVLTPDLQFGFPHSDYVIFFSLHIFLLILPIYCIICFNWRINWEDCKRAFIYGNIYMLCTLPINYVLGANYFYTMRKPPGPSLLDLFGPWPQYLFVVEGIAIILFLLAYLPFLSEKRNQV